MKKSSTISVAFLTFVMLFAVQASNAASIYEQNPNNNFEQSSEVLSSVTYLNILDGKCGEASGTAKKKTEAKTKSKTSEGKCGEGKCGTATGKAEKKVDAKGKTETKATTDVKAKSSEGKCGEGTSKTEKSTSKKAKSSEGKCGVA